MNPASAMSLIPPHSGFAILAVFFVLAALGAVSELTRVGKRVSGVMVTIALSLLLANLGVIPRAAPAYDVIWVYLVPLAIALFLVKADLISIVVEGGRTLVAFAFGAIGVIAGAWLGTVVLNLGPHEADYVGVFSATYTGGSLNYAAVAEAIGFREPTSLAAGVAIDNVVGLAFLLLVGAAPGWAWFRRHFAWRSQRLTDEVEADLGQERSPGIIDLAVALALGAFACAVGNALADALGEPSYGILFITIIMVAIATLGRRWLRSLAGAELLATLFMYLFFALLGAGADLGAMLGAAPALFAFVLIIFAVHIVFILLGAKLCRLNHGEIVVASLACIGGPPVAVAFAVLFGWRRLVVPAVATGVLGYVVGNFIGIGLFELVSG